VEGNVEKATKLYSEVKEDSCLIYPAYKEAIKQFNRAHESFSEVTDKEGEVDENTPLETRVEYVKAFQELKNVYEAF
jgi:type I restriction enzyme, R subunit